MKKTCILLLLYLIGFCAIAQTKIDSIQVLDEVVLSDVKLKHYASGIKVTILNDSILDKNSSSLTGLLAFNSNIYFKENGFGMVSSPAFRGTNASQTAVIWNGININSQLNGQTDFNTINTTNFSSITIRSGGGSVQYGSGAIGGSIHLNNKLAFYTHFENTLKLSYGSFNTKQINYVSSFGDALFSGSFGIAYIDSENDYKYLGTNISNENGQFNNLSLNANLGFIISKTDVLKLYHQSFIGDKNFSGTLVAPSRSKYEDENYRTLIEWSKISGTVNSKLKAAYLQESFKYFENKDKANYSFGVVNTYLLNHSLNVRLSKELQFKTLLDYSVFKGEGGSFGDPKRTAFSATTLINHKPTKNLSYDVSLRKDFTSSFKSPFVFSIAGYYVFSKCYKIQINASKNYRVPTFNDLFWEPGGNLDLKSESSYQIDLGQEFQKGIVYLKFNTFYIKTEDLIKWTPNTVGAWSPININEAENYGAEVALTLKKSLNANHIELKGNYAYTVAEDKATKKQLIYVPFHKANVALAYNYKVFSVYYQHLFNDEVSIIGGTLNGYDFGNLGLSYKLETKTKYKCIVNFKINNIYNTYYENVALRPMQNRNYNLQLILKF